MESQLMDCWQKFTTLRTIIFFGSDMFGFNVAFHSSSMRRSVLTVSALPIRWMSALNIVNFIHLGHDNIYNNHIITIYLNIVCCKLLNCQLRKMPGQSLVVTVMVNSESISCGNIFPTVRAIVACWDDMLALNVSLDGATVGGPVVTVSALPIRGSARLTRVNLKHLGRNKLYEWKICNIYIFKKSSFILL